MWYGAVLASMFNGSSATDTGVLQAVYHQGPISIFLSKAPGSVQEYQGDGLWAKAIDLGTLIDREFGADRLLTRAYRPDIQFERCYVATQPCVPVLTLKSRRARF